MDEEGKRVKISVGMGNDLFLEINLNNDRIMFQLNRNNRRTMVVVWIHRHYAPQEMSFKMNDLETKF